MADRIRLTSALVVDPLYLQHGYSDATIDYRHWGVPLSRRFRSLKLWFVLRSYGISGIQKYIRRHIKLAQRFEEHVLKDKRFEICNQVKVSIRLILVTLQLCRKVDYLISQHQCTLIYLYLFMFDMFPEAPRWVLIDFWGIKTTLNLKIFFL